MMWEFKPLDLFSDHDLREYVGPDGEYHDWHSRLQISDAPTAPTGYELVGFRLAYAYLEGPHSGVWRLSCPVREQHAIEAEVALRDMFPENFLTTQLRPVWGRVPEEQATYKPPAPTYDKVTVHRAVEAAKYFAHVVKDDPAKTIEVLEVYQSYVAEIACTDYWMYEFMCKDQNLAPLTCSNSHHVEELHES